MIAASMEEGSGDSRRYQMAEPDANGKRLHHDSDPVALWASHLGARRFRADLNSVTERSPIGF